MQNQKKFPTSHHSPLTETKTADGTIHPGGTNYPFAALATKRVA
ncbi:hypothetical protein TBK1r_26370 [Stieleria magnilauensis]|uniref:Uncharacterized protein n=1 Tax=Stieleria magnilauensis TaxID=2527963 RepID=A0ABX5XRV0_9BACT|nr:hypothetical protein TBK1r_26370 [Planctomycetes bacterium TBK1r]